MPPRSIDCLLQDITFAINQGLGPRDLLPMLADLIRQAPRDSQASRFARLNLATLVLDSEPFRAASLAHRMTRENQHDDQAFGVLGMALSFLGHHRAAARAYRQAVRLAPSHPGHSHNLGHLLDVAFQRPHDALNYLKRAFMAEPRIPEIASSYAHALARAGQVELARHMLHTATGDDSNQVERTIQGWLDRSETSSEEKSPALGPPGH